MTLRTFTHHLAAEQVHLDEALDDVDRALRAGEAGVARRRLDGFGNRFERYVRKEERVLFALVDRRDPVQSVATARMRREHACLRLLIQAVSHALRLADPPRGLDALDSLRSVFVLHHAKEAWLLHPRLPTPAALGEA